MRREKGITLIALVVTIVVLLILAGVSISMLTGENGIIKQAQDSKEATTQAKAEEMVTIAIGSLQTKSLGDTSKITPELIANQVMEDNNIKNVIAEGSEFPTNIIFVDDGVKVGVNINLSIGEIGSYDGIYSEEGLEGKIAPEDLFNYEVIDNAEVGATVYNNLPQKTVRITGIKAKYCNGYGYNPDTDEFDLEDTNYEVKYDNDVITNEKTLVVPYQVDGKYITNGIDGEFYKVVEVNLTVRGGSSGASSLPNIETIIYPNTVTKVMSSGQGNDFETKLQKRVILSENLKAIPDNFFNGMENLMEINIPDSVTSIGYRAFSRCHGLSSVTIPEGVTYIGNEAFYSCSELTKIAIPNSVIDLGEGAFYNCGKLTNITMSNNITTICEQTFFACSNLINIVIPDSVKTIEKGAFQGCDKLTNIIIPKNVTSIGERAFSGCDSLTSMIIPQSVTNIGDYAFGYCYGLVSITIPDNVINMGSNVFSQWRTEQTINVPFKENERPEGWESGWDYLCRATINYLK